MNGYHTLNKPVGYKKPHRENEESVLAFSQNIGGKTTGKKHKYNKNGEPHFFHCGGEYHWGNNFPELNKDQQGKVHAKFKNEEPEDEMVVTRLSSNRWPYIK